MPCALFPLAVVVLMVVGAAGRNIKTPTADLACPPAADILPCVCSASPDGGSLDMECSAVTDEDELAGVFQANFPATAFRRLTIDHNKALRVLHDSVLGDTTYKEIRITDGILEEVQKGALSGSASTVRNLVFNRNNIANFPFSSLQDLTELLSLDLRRNNLHELPEFASATLQVLYLSHNPLGALPVNAFIHTPSLADLHLSNTDIPHILPGTLEGLGQLQIVGLGNNHLHELVSDAVQCSAATGLVDVGYNDIRTVQPNAFPGLLGGWLYIHHNSLTTLEEEVWRPILEDDGYLDPYGNPLVCECDIAWLLRNVTLLDHVDKYTTCADGRLLRKLNPADYDHC